MSFSGSANVSSGVLYEHLRGISQQLPRPKEGTLLTEQSSCLKPEQLILVHDNCHGAKVKLTNDKIDTIVTRAVLEPSFEKA